MSTEAWTTERVLRAARARILQGWTKGLEGERKNGRPINPLDPAAARWCMLGAVRRAVFDMGLGREEARRAFDAATWELSRSIARAGYGVITEWNDTRHSKYQVLELMDTTIARVAFKAKTQGFVISASVLPITMTFTITPVSKVTFTLPVGLAKEPEPVEEIETLEHEPERELVEV